jgi:DUF438 domain-containing protein
MNLELTDMGIDTYYVDKNPAVFFYSKRKLIFTPVNHLIL